MAPIALAAAIWSPPCRASAAKACQARTIVWPALALAASQPSSTARSKIAQTRGDARTASREEAIGVRDRASSAKDRR
jgi:hypothetical protein